MSLMPFEELTSVRVLIIDDNPTVHDAFKEILGQRSRNDELDADEAVLFGPAATVESETPVFELDHALSGPEGIEKVRTALAAERPYQVAFVDIRMPGMDGMETIAEVWKLDGRIQTVICTAYADYEWADLAKRFGPTDRLLVLKKPFHNIEAMQLASTLGRKWFLGKAAAIQFEQMETLVAQRTQKLVEFHRREHRQIQELDQSKLRSLVRLARDFREPLTLIVNPLDEAVNGRALAAAELAAMQRQGQRLLQLLDLSLLMRRMEPAEQPLECRDIELVSFTRGLLQGFSAVAAERQVQWDFSAKGEPLTVWTDPTIVEKALFNLFSYSLKTAPASGRIVVRLQPVADEVGISVAFAGAEASPIPAGFENEATRVEDVYLLLTREMLSLVKGKLEIESSPDPAAPKNSRLEIRISLPAARPEGGVVSACEPGSVAEANEEKESPLLMMVAANTDLRKFIQDGFEEGYRWMVVQDYAAAPAVAHEHVPDLIIADFDIPGGDALAFCAALKNHQLTSHIPLVLLGAGISDHTQLKALEAGVDDCVMKPFRLALLKARVANLLEARRKWHRHFADVNPTQPRELAANQMDAEFLRRVVSIVEKNLSDYEFDVKTLARLLAVSRRQLFRKFKAVAGCTPNAFIRDIRLKHAAQLLQETGLTVSEIIYAVGFSDPKYFRAVFRERFGVLPGEYAKAAKPGPGRAASQ
ncbi:MAG TPA: response regulator [Verrucomicrobiae bacterium]|jgi:CheY-like chemotaxis protein/AraC-like DNA-binding protein|nr:response regulator [Verrucomicrobiae bacterium]